MIFEWICRFGRPFLGIWLLLSTAGAAAQTNPAVDLRQRFNEQRQRAALPLLQANEQLDTAAQIHADYMADIAYVTHYGPNDSREEDRAAAAGYTAGVTELIFGGAQDDADRPIAWWLSQPEFRELIYNTRYNEIGVGTAVNDDLNWRYWVVVLGEGVPETAVSPTAAVPTATNRPPTAVPTRPPATATMPPTLTATPPLLPTVTAVPTMPPLTETTAVPPTMPPPASPTPLPTDSAIDNDTAPPPTAVALISTPQIESFNSTTSSPSTISSADTAPTVDIDHPTPTADWWLPTTAVLIAPLLAYAWYTFTHKE